MSSVGTGHPDGEARAMPHGEPLEAGASITATAAGTVESPAAGYWPVAAHRSVVVVVRNTGANDILVTPRWSFLNGTFVIRVPADPQTVQAGTTRRLIFQNQGDIIDQITFAGIGGDSAMSYYLTGSNLDPLAPSSRALLSLIRRTPAQVIPTGAGTLIEYGTDPATRFYTNDAASFSYTLTGAGDIQLVHILKPGIYLVSAYLSWGAVAGNYSKQLALLCASSTTHPPLALNPADIEFDTVAVKTQQKFLFAIEASYANAAGNSVSVQGFQNSGGNVTVDDSILQIVALSSTFP